MTTTARNNRYKIQYMNAVVRKFAIRKALPLIEAFHYLLEHRGLALLDECYEAIHLQSIDDAVDDLTVACQRNGGTLK